MAHHKAAKKSIRQDAKRLKRNTMRESRIRTFVKQVEVAVSNKDKKAATEALKTAQKELQRGVSKGVLRKETVSRKISRLNAKIKLLAA